MFSFNIFFHNIVDGTEVKVGEYNGVSEELDLNRGRGIRSVKVVFKIYFQTCVSGGDIGYFFLFP